MKGFLVLICFFAAVIGAMSATFLVAYGAVAWLDLPDLAHGVLAIVAIALSVAAGAFAARFVDRIINRPPLATNQARARR